MIRRLAAALTVAASLLVASPAHAATTAPPAEVAAFPVSVDRSSVNGNLDLIGLTPSFAAQTLPASYVVQRGDTLSRIAARFCGTSSAYRSIGAASGIGNFDLIYPGQRLVLKCSGAVTAPKAAPKAAPKLRAQTASVAVSGSASGAVSFALAQVGKRYVWGTAGPSSYDCSGLVMAAFARIGIRLPHQSGGIAGYGRPVSGPLQPGDVLFLSGRGGVYHVMIYAGSGQIVEAASPGQGVIKHAIYPYSFARRLI
jgi:cell wall-associated NlpC family hydrolase